MFHFGLNEYSKNMLLSVTIKLVRDICVVNIIVYHVTLVHDDDKYLATLKSFSVQRYFKSMETTRCHSNAFYVNLALTECKKKCSIISSSNRRGIGLDGAGHPSPHYSQPYPCFA